MKVCVLIDAWEPEWGGGQTHVWEISRRLIESHNYSVDIYTRALYDNLGRAYTENEIYFGSKLRIFRTGHISKFFSLTGRLFWVVSVISKVYKNHRQYPYSLIHAHAYVAAVPGKILSILLNIPIVFTVHGANNLELNNKNMAAVVEKWLLTQISFDCEISVSRSFLKYKNVNKRIEIVANGVDLADFNVLENKSRLKNKYFTLLWVGRFDKVKAVDVLLEALKIVVDIHKKVRLMLVGYGSEEKNLQNLAKKLKLDKFVSFEGKKSRKEIYKYYKQADILVLPSRSEGLAITLLEAWAAKVPVIATRVGDHGLLVQHNKNGFLVEPENSQKLAKVIDAAMFCKSLKKYGENGCELVRLKYTWELAIKKINKIYKSLI